jgi:hypothetical protein
MFFGHCASEPFQDCEPQSIEISDQVASRIKLSDKAMVRAKGIVDGKVGEVDWDVGESSSPIVITHKFPFYTGRSERVETVEGDEIFYAQVQRRGAPIWGRFIKSRKGQMSRSQTVILRPVSDLGPVGWNIVAAYIGEPAPAFPGDPFASANSQEYWMSHALVDGAVPYHKGTETTDCPWQ